MNHSSLHPEQFMPELAAHREQFDRFCELLAEENQKYNLTRITEPGRIEIRHFLDSLVGLSVLDNLAKKIGNPLKILDLGSGAGFPGLVLAIVRPAWQITSLEATGKKATFQKIVCDALKLDNVTVMNGRAEALAHEGTYRETFDAVTARALAATPILAELSLGFVRPGRIALFWKGPTANEELQTASTAIKQMGAEVENVLSYTLETTDAEPANLSLIVCNKIKPTPKQYPRVYGIVKKNPLL